MDDYIGPRCKEETNIDNGSHASCCFRPVWEEVGKDKCIWHAEISDDEEISKSIENLRKVREEQQQHQGKREYPPMGNKYSPTELLDDITLSGCKFDIDRDDDEIGTFNQCSLRQADFSNTILCDADFSGADLCYANFTGAVLNNTDFSKANLRDADFSGAKLYDADLSEAKLRNADLPETDLRKATFTKADPRVSTLQGADLHGATFFKLGDNYMDSADDCNQIARASHDLSSMCSERGLVKRARRLKRWERRARREEASANGDTLEEAKLRLSWQVTGYGISVIRVIRNMAILFSLSTLIYVIFGIEENSLPLIASVSEMSLNGFLRESTRVILYSILTFTTAPPDPASGTIVQWTTMIEAIFGTLLIVLLGYVLANRESF